MWEGAKKSSKAIRPASDMSELSKRAAAAAEKRFEAKGKGKESRSPSQSRLNL